MRSDRSSGGCGWGTRMPRRPPGRLSYFAGTGGGGGAGPGGGRVGHADAGGAAGEAIVLGEDRRQGDDEAEGGHRQVGPGKAEGGDADGEPRGGGDDAGRHYRQPA